MNQTNKRAFTTIKAGHHYQVPFYRVAPAGIEVTGEMMDIVIVKGSKVVDENREPAVDGTVHEHILSVMIEDLKLKQAEHPCKETACAITHLQEALHWMEERANRRAAQGVLGTYQSHKS